MLYTHKITLALSVVLMQILYNRTLMHILVQLNTNVQQVCTTNTDRQLYIRVLHEYIYTFHCGFYVKLVLHGYLSKSGIYAKLVLHGYLSKSGLYVKLVLHGYLSKNGIYVKLVLHGYLSKNGLYVELVLHGYLSKIGLYVK